MLIFMMFLCVLMVIILLIQFRIYTLSFHKTPSANTSLTEECATTMQTPFATEMLDGHGNVTISDYDEIQEIEELARKIVNVFDHALVKRS